VRGLSEGDRLAVDFNGFSRLRNALVVCFAGGIAAMFAVGRTLRPAGAAREPGTDDPGTEDLGTGDSDRTSAG
jgi:hypothetical protein